MGPQCPGPGHTPLARSEGRTTHTMSWPQTHGSSPPSVSSLPRLLFHSPKSQKTSLGHSEHFELGLWTAYSHLGSFRARTTVWSVEVSGLAGFSCDRLTCALSRQSQHSIPSALFLKPAGERLLDPTGHSAGESVSLCHKETLCPVRALGTPHWHTSSQSGQGRFALTLCPEVFIWGSKDFNCHQLAHVPVCLNAAYSSLSDPMRGSGVRGHTPGLGVKRPGMTHGLS